MSNKAKTKPKQEARPRKTYLFRIYPTHKQSNTLEQWLGFRCQLYNAALDERTTAYRMAGISLSSAHPTAELPACKHVRPHSPDLPSHAHPDPVKPADPG